MGLFDKLLGGGKKRLEDDYFETLVQLGELVVRSPPRGVRLRHGAAVRKVQEMLRNRQLELQMIEQAMEEEERHAQEVAAEEEALKPELERLVHKHRAAIAYIERKIAATRKQLTAREANFKYFVKQLEEQEKKVEKHEEAGRFEEAESERAQLKRVRLDHMRQESALVGLKEEIDMHLDSEGEAGEGMRAKMRLEEIQENEKSRDADLVKRLGQLDAQAAEKEQEIHDAEEALADALAALGEEVYRARLPGAGFQPIYDQLDPIAQALAGK